MTATAQGGVAPFTYTWVGPGGFNQINVHNNATDQVTAMIAGTYQVTVMDATGCPGATTSINVVEYFTDIIANPGNDFSICGTPAPTLNLSGSVSATNSGIWSGGEGSFSPDAASLSLSYTPTADEIAAGSVTLTLTPTNTLGCPFIPNDITISLTQFTDAITINPVDISCFGLSNGSIDLTIDGGTPGYSYAWNNGATTEDLSGLTAGTYSVTITDANGCQHSNQIFINQPEELTSAPEITSDYNGSDISCFGASDGSASLSVNGGTPGYTYIWMNSENEVIGSSPTISGIPSGVYNVLTIDANGCQSSASVTLSDPEFLFTDINTLTDYYGLPVSCENKEDGVIEVVFEGGTPTYTIAWENPASNSAILANIGPGEYTVTIYDANGCQISDNIVLEGHPIPEFSPAPPVEVCIGDELILDCITEPGNNVIWTFSNGYTDNSCSPSPFTVDFVGCIDASVEVTSPFGCTNTWLLSDYICSNPLPDADFTTTPSDVTFISSTAYFENLSTGAVSYEWNFGDNSPNSFQENVQHTFPDAGPGQYTITLIATSEFGCIDSISKPIRVKDALIFYVPNTFTPDGDNFNNTFLPVFYSGFDPYDYTLLIFNRWGECIFESHNVEIGWDGTYNGKMAQDGTYTWNIEVRNVEDSKRFQQTGHVNLIR